MKNHDVKKQHLYEVNCLVGAYNNDRVPELAKKILDWVEKRKGEMVKVEKKGGTDGKTALSDFWVGKRRLAYTIRKDKAGYYLNSWIKINPGSIDDFKHFLKLEKEIIRYAIFVEKEDAILTPAKDAVTLKELDQLNLQQPRKRYGEENKPMTQEQIVPVKQEIRLEKTVKEEEKKEEILEKTAEVPIEKEIVKEREENIEAAVVSAEEKIVEKKPDEVVKELAEEEISLADPPVTIEKKPKVKKESIVDEEKKVVVEKELLKPEQEEKSAKHKKISLEELDERLDDILNQDIL